MVQGWDVHHGARLDEAESASTGAAIPVRVIARLLVLSLLLALGVGWFLHLLHLGEHEAAELPGWLHWLRDSLLALPAAATVGLAVHLGAERALRRAMSPIPARLAWATVVGTGYAIALVPGGLVHGRMFGAEHAHGDPLVHALQDGAAGAPAAVVVAALAAAIVGLPSERGIAVRRWRSGAASALALWEPPPSESGSQTRSLRVRMAGLLSVLTLLGLSAPVIPWSPAGPAGAAPSPTPECTAGSADRVYDVAAVNVVIPFNRWGDVNRHGQVFVLEQDKDAVRHWHYPLDTASDGTAGTDVAGNRRLRPRPLVLRANEGECVQVNFANELHEEAPVLPTDPLADAAAPNPPLSGLNEGLPTGDQPASMHVHGASFNVQTSDGGKVGFNDDTTVPTGDSIQYFWRAPAVEGLYFFHDHVTVSGSEADGGSNANGLFGALAVEPDGSRWFDPVTGAELSTGAAPYTDPVIAATSGELYLDAIIVPPAAQSGSGFAPHDGTAKDVHSRNEVAFREMVQISQDEIPGDHLQNCDFQLAAGLIASRAACTDPAPVTAGGEVVGLDFGLGLGFNYGTEPLLARQEPINRCPDCVGEETWLSSWPYGDPALVKLASGLGPWYPGWHPWLRDGTGQLVNVDGGGNPIQQPGALVDPEDCGLADTAVDRDFDGTVDDAAPTSCWTSNVIHAYQFDATKVRFVHAGPKETHVFHMHAHQWLQDPRDVGASGHTPGQPGLAGPTSGRPEATTIDSQTFGPGESFTNDVLFGAGSRPGTVGDAIFHCHLYPHFAEGFWSLWRVHDVLEDGSGRTPDGTGVKNVLPLPDRHAFGAAGSAGDNLPPTPSTTNPGYPRFLPGQYGWRAPQPIAGVSVPNGAADDAATSLIREDLSFATRVVAGQALDLDYLHQVQQVHLTAPPPASFALTYRGETTTPIAPGAPPDTAASGGDGSSVEEHLEALATIDDVTVSGSGIAADPWVITFLAPAINVVALAAAAPEVVITPDFSTNPVAGQLAAEDANTGGAGGAVTDRTGQAARPGAAWVDPCPAGARTVTYNVSIIQLDVSYNEDDWHDPQGRVLVLDRDVDAVLSGQQEPVPLFFRANPGDCINFNLTNRLPNWLGNDDFLELIQTNMVGQHIHLVKFDVTSSDGASNGWNYQEAAFSEDQRAFNDEILAGARSCNADTFDGFELTGDGCRIPHADGAGFTPDWRCDSMATCPVGQTLHERWYVDYELRTVFTHDHHFPAEDQNRGYFAALVGEPAGTDFRHPFTGEFFQPIDDPAHGPTCASFPVTAAEGGPDGRFPGTTSACEGTARGTQMDVIGAGGSDDFRELSLGVQDFVSLYRPCSTCDPSVIAGEEPLNPPAEPEAYPDDDPGVFGLNYKNAPFLLRDTVSGVPSDPAYVFSSTVHGDPRTPIFQAYAGDPVRVRLIQGSQEEQHVIQFHGMRWRDEPDDPGSPLVGSRALGISDAFNFEIPQMQCGVGEDCRGDYLYSGTSTDDVWSGAWGILRVFGKGVQGLLPLPDNVPQAANGNTNFNPSGSPPPKASSPGSPCPAGAPVRAFPVIGVDAPITYNESGDHDPFGLVYARQLPGETPAEAAARVRASNPSPMVLHVNEGDCVEVTLTNMIDVGGAFATEHAPVGAQEVGADLSGPAPHGFDPPLVLEPTGPGGGTPAGLRISLHPALLQYDVRGSDGAVVGFNRDQTVAPAESITYRWWADDVTPGELGAVNLTDYGDVRGHRHHGLFAGLVVHPAGGSFHDPITGETTVSGAAAAMAEAGAVLAAAGVASPTELSDPARDEWQSHVEEANRLAAGEQVDVRIHGAGDYRNWSVFFQDGLNLWSAAGLNLPDQLDHPPTPEEPAGALPDAEDRGEKGFSYRNASFHHRFGQQPGEPHDALPGEVHRDVFSSTVHGDPATPIFRAYAGDDVRVRVLQGADKPRQHSFQVSGHAWARQPFDDPADTELVGTTGGFSVGRALNLHLVAGGDVQLPGDHRYNCGVLSHHQSGGLWGIARVYAPPAVDPAVPFVPDPLGTATVASASGPSAADTPHDPEYHPITPLELVQVGARVWDDTDRDGTMDAGEKPLGHSTNGDPALDGVEVQLALAGADNQVGTADDIPVGSPATTRADGSATFQVAPGHVYALRGTVPPDWAATNFGWTPVDATSQAQAPSGALGFVQLGDLAVRLFEDTNGDNLFNGLDEWAPGQTVSITGPSGTLTGTTSDGTDGHLIGTASFTGVLPGHYDVTVTPWEGRTASGPPVAFNLPENGALTDMAGFRLTSGLKVQLFSDADSDGAQGTVGGLPETGIAGWTVELRDSSGAAVVATATSGPQGVADFGDVPAGTYRIRPIPIPGGWTTTAAGSTATFLTDNPPAWSQGDSFTPATSCVGGGCEVVEVVVLGETSHLTTIGLHTDRLWMSASLYNDVDNDGVRDGGEKKLVGWDAELWRPGGSAPLAASVVGSNGAVTFAIDGEPSPGPHTFQIRLRQPDTSTEALSWRPTPNASTSSPSAKDFLAYEATALSGHEGRIVAGFIQLGTIGAQVWHDLDRNGANDDYEPPLPGRTVRLLSRNGKTVLAQKASDDGGYAAFEVPASTEFQLQVRLEDGWVASFPLASNGSATTQTRVLSSSSPTQSVVQEFGQYARNDVTPPPVPVASPPGGTYTSSQLVALTSESGADIWYTTDASTPSPTNGQLYANSITVAADLTLKAIARDAAGNLSGIMTETYVISGGGGGGGGGGAPPTQTVAPTSWSVEKGLHLYGSVPGDIISDNGRPGGAGYLAMGSVVNSRKQVIRAVGSVSVAPGSAVTQVTLDAYASKGGISRSLLLWNFGTSRWDLVNKTNEPSADSGPVSFGVSGAGYVSGSGEIRVRIETSAQSGHEHYLDQLTFRVQGP